MALYKNNSNIAQISLYGGGGTSAALPGVINTSYGANTPVIPTTPTPTPVTFQAGSLVVGANQVNPALLYSQNTLVKPPVTSMGANVMIAGSGNYGGGTGNGGVTDEGVVLGNPNVNNSTFNNITESPSPTYAQFSGEVSTGNDNKVDLSYGGNAGAGTGVGTVTPPVETPPTEVETPPVVTPPTDTSGSEGGGTSTPTDTTIDSYYDYLKTEMPEHLKGIYNDTIAAIDQANAKTIAEINAAKERGIVDANTSYQHNLSTYGAKNEALRGMGLAGSGYSEYLDSQAYATQRAEVQGVKASALAAENNANATVDAQKLEAKTALDENLLYYDNLAEQHLEGKWSEILTGAGNGTYSKEQVENLAKYYGFSDEQIATLTGAADSYETEKAEAEANAIGEKFLAALGDVKQGIYDEEDIPALVSQFNFSPEQEAQLIKEAQEFKKNTSIAPTIKDEVRDDPSIYDDKDLSDMVESGTISQPEADDIALERDNTTFNAVASALNGGNVETIAQAYATLEEYKFDKLVSEEVYNEIKGLLNNTTQGLYYQYSTGKIDAKTYNQKMKALGVSNTTATIEGGWTIQGLGTGRNNDDVDITIGSTSRGEGKGEFDLLCGEAITDTAIISALNKVATGNANTYPATEGTWWTWLHSDTANSKDTPGKLVLYNGGLYLYGTKGWVPIKNDNDDEALDKCIAAILSSSKQNNIASP